MTVGYRPAQHPRQDAGLLFTCVVLAVIILVGIALRLYRISEQSVWFDEAISFAFVDKPDFTSYLQSQYVSNWNLVPLYYAFQYYWANWVNDSIVGARILSIVFGMLSVPLIYLLGRDLYGRRAGLVAALCLAVSAVHIYQAQELRNYSLTTLTALLCGYTFWKVLRGGSWRWWVCNAVAHLLLIWTHLFGCWLLVAEGCVLLLFRYGAYRRTALWFGINLALMIPTLFWIRGMAGFVWPGIQSPSLEQVIGNCVSDCYSAIYYPIPTVFPGYPCVNLPPEWTRPFIESFALFDNLLLVFFLLAIIWLGYSTYRRVRVKAPEPATRGARWEPLERFLFPLLWLLLPVLVLLVLAHVWRPDCFAQKYTTYCSLALYLLIGGAIESLARPSLRWIAVAVLLVLFGHRLVLYETQTQRTEWAAATGLIREQQTGNDVMVVHSATTPYMATFAMKPFKMPEEPAADLEEMCKKTDAFLLEGKHVWVLWLTACGEQIERFDRYLSARGWKVSRRGYWAAQLAGILVLHIQPDVTAGADITETYARAYQAATLDYDAARSKVEEGRALQARNDEEGALAAYRKALVLNPEYVEAFNSATNILLGHQRNEDAAIAISQAFIARYPNHASGHVQLGNAYLSQGDEDAAIEAFEKALELDPYDFCWIRTTLEGLLSKKAKRKHQAG